MILLGYRHGLRASELCDLQWSQVELATGRLHVRRAKNGTPSVHPLRGEELRALRRLQRECGPSPYVFQSERGGPMTPKSFHALFGRIGVWAKMPFPIHPHMLRAGQRQPRHSALHRTGASPVQGLLAIDQRLCPQPQHTFPTQHRTICQLC
jgi:integrase